MAVTVARALAALDLAQDILAMVYDSSEDNANNPSMQRIGNALDEVNAVLANGRGQHRYQAPRLTARELDLIAEMMAIAGAGDMNEGDYQGWEDDWHSGCFNRLGDKIHAMRRGAHT